MYQTTYRRAAGFVPVLLSLLGLFATLGHYVFRLPVEEALASEFGPSPAWHTEQLPLYDQHAVITFLHLLPATLFMIFAPLQLSQRLRQRFTRVHRLMGRTLLALGLVMAVYGIVLGWVMPFGGKLETIVSMGIGLGFLCTGYLGFRAIRKKRFAQHRRWMSYMLAFAYTPMTMRLLLAILTEGMGMDGQALFAQTMFAGMVLNLMLVYGWVHRETNNA